MMGEIRHLIVTVELHSGGEQLYFESCIAPESRAIRQAQESALRAYDWVMRDLKEVGDNGGLKELLAGGRLTTKLDIAFAVYNESVQGEGGAFVPTFNEHPKPDDRDQTS